MKGVFFNKTILNIVSNFIPHEALICDDRGPPWINTWIKNRINDKKILYKKYLCSGKNTKVFEEFKLLQNKIVNLTNDSWGTYYTRISNIPEYLNLMNLAYPQEHTGQF